MAKIAFLLMAHRNADKVVAQARALTAHGDYLVLHWDKNAASGAWAQIKSDLAKNPNVAFADRVKCGWGEFSLVQASLNLIKAAQKKFTDASHYFLISGDCYPTKPRAYFDEYLSDDKDIIEINDFFESGWIRTGLQEDRLIYRHWFNERSQKWLFYKSLEMQRRFEWSRPLPAGLTIQIGSQWWVLRAATIDRMMKLLRKRRDVTRFFRTTWIPDETFFQTLVKHLVPQDQIINEPPTHLRFSDYGMPVVFHLDHADYLFKQPKLFARKISPHAAELQTELLAKFTSDTQESIETNGDLSVYQYLSDRGRKGRRFAPRFWETAISPRRRAELLVVVSKLWHIGEAIQEKASELTGYPNLGYIFDEDREVGVPLGNLERQLGKRGRHRVALMNLIYDALDTEKIILCLDPSRSDALAELIDKIGDVRILLVDRPISPAHVRSHALRTGLIGDASGESDQSKILSALTHEFDHEVKNLQENFAGRTYLNALGRNREDNVLDIGNFLRIQRSGAEALAREAERHKN